MDDKTIDAAERILGVRFRDPALLEEAITHASVAQTRLASNERLEFLGDAVLGAIVCEHIFREYPDLLEGDMTKIKSTVVSRRACAELAIRLGLPELLVLGKGMQTRGEIPASLAAAVFESIIGAMFLEHGMDAVRRFLLPLIAPAVARAHRSGHQQNFKSVLQQHAQQELETSPAYVILAEEGPDHAKRFCVAVELDGRRFPAAWGKSKKQAEQKAALLALREMRVVDEDDDGDYIVVDPLAGNGEGDADASFEKAED